MRLSVVVASRNDDHGGDLVERTQAFVDLLHAQALRHCIEVELILVEWNAPDDRPYMHTLLCWPPSTALWSAVTIIVGADVHEELTADARLRFVQFWAKNVGIRQARHGWILCTNPDVIFSDDLCEALTKIKGSRRTIFGTHRLDMDVGIDQVPAGGTLEDLLPWCEEHVIRRNIITSNGVLTDGCGDFMLTTKVAWNKLRGYPELKLWSIHLDSLALMQLIYVHKWQQQVLPGGIFHIKHGASWLDDMGWGKKLPQLRYPEVVKMFNEMRESGHPAYHNSKHWGLAGRFQIRVVK